MSAPSFQIGERIAVPRLPVFKVENGVAVLAKSRPRVAGGCGARHYVEVFAPFAVRGGFRVEEREFYRVSRMSLAFDFERKGGARSLEEWGTWYFPKEWGIWYLTENEVISMLETEKKNFLEKGFEVRNERIEAPRVRIYYRKFRHGEYFQEVDSVTFWFRYNGTNEFIKNPYMVYEFINPSEAKLVDDAKVDYVLIELEHKVSSRTFAAEIMVDGDGVVWKDIKRTACAVDSVAVGFVIARYGSRVTIAKNAPPYRGSSQSWEVEVWEATLPPRRVSSRFAEEPLTASDIV
ncbi:MAG: hypothetical protein LM580_11870 [Thermofilum sp.]|nr:hypothetical protein [Thermofilum sp.]